MTRAPRLISSRTPLRNSSAPSQIRMPPDAPSCQYQGALSLEWPVVLNSRPPGMKRGPSMTPSAMPFASDASTSHAAPADTAPVKPQRSAVRRLRAPISPR